MGVFIKVYHYHDNELQSLYGQKTQDEDNYLTNFVIEAYLQLITVKARCKSTWKEKHL